jgi:uncharacterized protein
MTKDFDLTKLQVLKFAQSAGHEQGRERMERLHRLMAEQKNSLNGQDALMDNPASQVLQAELGKWVDWSLAGFCDPQGPHAASSLDAKAGFILQAHALIQLTCQRCLGLSIQKLDVHRTFRFVRDEQTAMALDDESDDEFLVLSNAFDVLELIEDELIMALPLVPLHELCPVPLTQQLGQIATTEAQNEEERPHPFAALSVLKSKKQ